MIKRNIFRTIVEHIAARVAAFAKWEEAYQNGERKTDHFPYASESGIVSMVDERAAAKAKVFVAAA